ncbi:MAG TPA: SBBP repeat-containing protein, partial [Bryobacteraceae bacterium]|nr:SBBP repeat-containing protein [Bryobacteraceae bacterium]
MQFSLFSAVAAPVGAGGRQVISNLPASFEPNRGQTDRRYNYVSRGMGYSLSVGPAEALLQLASQGKDGSAKRSATVGFKMLGANSRARGRALADQPGKTNYFIGDDPARWLKDVPRYGRIEYREVYPGIDLAYYGAAGQLEYDFVLGPHANPRRIRMQIEGAEQIEIDGQGDLVIHVAGSEIREKRPVVYQQTPGGRRLVEARYVALGGNRVGFETESYDPAKPLVIDPSIVFSTFFGGAGNDGALGVVLDANGNFYVTGFTRSAPISGAQFGQPFTGTPPDGKGGPGIAEYVAKISPTGALLFITYFGGTSDQIGGHIALDSSNNIYVAGNTASSNFPTLNPFQKNFGGGTYDAYLLKLNSAGNSLIYSTYLGGSGDDFAYGIQVDSFGEPYIVGQTSSTNFPTANATQPHYAGGLQDAFAAKFSANGTSLLYSTYFGGSVYETAKGLVLDSLGNSYMFGFTGSSDFPQQNPLALASTCNWPTRHAFAAKLTPTGGTAWSTLICGTDGDDAVNAGVLTPSGNLLLGGETSSTTFPATMNAVQASFAGGPVDAFITELDPTGVLLYSTYLGGSDDDAVDGMAVDSMGNWYIAGDTASVDFPTVHPIQGSNPASTAAFLVKFASPSSVVFSTYFAGSQDNFPRDIKADANGRAYIVGGTSSTDFPLKNPIQSSRGACGAPSNNGCHDSFWSVIATCDFTLSAPAGIAAAGGVGSISVATTPECGWTAASQVPWIVLAPSSGAGNGSVSYTVAPNNGPARNGSILVGGQTVAFAQAAGSAVAFTSSPAGASLTVAGAGCAPGSYMTPVNLTWNQNTNCTVGFPSPQTIGGFTYTFSSAAVNGGPSSVANPFNINSGTSALSINATLAVPPGGLTAASHFSVTPSSSSAVVGAPLSFTVTALDNMGATVANYSDPLSFTSSDGAAVLPTGASLTNGTGTFSVVFQTPGVQTLTVNDPFDTSVTGSSGNITVSSAQGLRYIP